MLTQKYKQQQQQVRVLTNESNYLKGMYFTDVPLTEGYSRVLINFDIDSVSGKIKPRKGLQSLGVVRPEGPAKQYLNKESGYNVLVDSKVCAVSDRTDPRKINRYLQAILYNTDTRALLAVTCDPEAIENSQFKISPFSVDHADEYIAPEPYVIAEPGVHGKKCIHNNFFKRPAGTFAFEDGFYTFLRRNQHAPVKLADLPSEDYEGITDYKALKESTEYSKGVPGNYFEFTSGISKGIIAYYAEDGNLQFWQNSKEEFLNKGFLDLAFTNPLCYTKLGAEILKAGDTLLDETILKTDIDPDKYYVCTIVPQQLNPTEAASWGYNMLLTDPYTFECENTAVNLVTILGILPYDKSGKVVLTPRRNQEITLKGYYRAPEAYHSDAQNPRFYGTTKKQINTTETTTRVKEEVDGTYRDTSGRRIYYNYVSTNLGVVKAYYYIEDYKQVLLEDTSTLVTETITESVTRDPKTFAELQSVVTDPNSFKYGDWWYCTEESKYYIIMPNGALNQNKLALFGDTQPPASVSLGLGTTGEENNIRVKWEMRSSGAATWTELSNNVFKLSDYYATHGDHAPFTYTGPMPSDEVLIKLTISDPVDVVEGEEYVLSTNTIGLSLVSDALANTLNLDAKNYDLSRCTGMCEWEQRLVLWGVPDALNTLFVSDVNNPTFFPYPNNVDMFPDPIIAVHNYGDELLVLTTSALYRLTWNTDGAGWSHTLVQQNLHVTEADTYLSCVIKNMFFFKSGDYYYMMVPKASSSSVRGEVTIAPISKLIANLLDNFHEEVYNLSKIVINQGDVPDFTNKFINYFSYVDNTRVVVNYVYALDNTTQTTTTPSTTDSKYLCVQLIYDTEIRTWTLRIFETAHMFYASHVDAIQQDRFVDITPALNGDQLVLQYYKFMNLIDTAVQYIKADGVAQPTLKTIKNYQYIDTGNRDINTELKKRFREFQFKVKNNTLKDLEFYTSFLIDGSVRKDLQRYEPKVIFDSSTGEYTIVVEKVLDSKLVAEDVTTLANLSDSDRWILGQSKFPGRTLWKVRMPITGKGLTPRVIMLATNESDYEIMGHAWAYRTMNGR